MPFCRFCGAPKEDEGAICARCNNQPVQYYMPPPPPRQEDEAVKVISIIAVVIVVIVVITVILAAVLYVMVIGFGTEGNYVPVGSWQSMSALSSTSGKIAFGVFSPEVAQTDIRINVEANGSDAGYLEWTDYSKPVVWNGAPAGASAAYVDYGQINTINSGDCVTFNGLKPDTTYSFTVLHLPSDSTIAMVGGQDSFTTAP